MRGEIKLIENEWIPMPDGRRLAARIWIPAGNGPFPAILEYLPYRKRDGTRPRDETTHPVFADAGYACIRVDIAGTGDSDGTFDDEYSEQELTDGESILAWIASQGWSDGSVGMIGISWGGFNSLQLAFRQPAELRAVVSVASTTDRYADDIHFMGGCLLTDNFNWAAQMFAYQTRPPDPELRDDWRDIWIKRMTDVPFAAAHWMQHPTRNHFWKHGSVCEDYTRVNVPVLAITGWADAYVNAPIQLLENLDVPVKAVIGPWEHRYAHISKLGAADFHSEVTGWFDRWLKGEQNGAEDLPDYRTYMQEHFEHDTVNTPRKGRWIAEGKWPSENVTQTRYFLGRGKLAPSQQSGGISIQTPSHVGQASGFFCAGMRIDNELPGEQSIDDALSVCLDTGKLEQPLELLGRAILNLTFTVDQPTAQIVARLCDVSPEDKSQRITYRAFNLAHHDGHENPDPLIPGNVYSVRVALNECAHRLRSGHTLRLALSNSYWPIVWPTPHPAEIVLNLAQCWIELPVRHATDEIDPSAPGPARAFSTYQAEILRDETSKFTRTELPDRTVVLETFDDFGQTRDPEHQLQVGSHVAASFAIHPDRPSSARMDTQWEFLFSRHSWVVKILTENSMHCDADNFFLHRKLRAFEGAEQTEVLSKEWSETMPRGLL